MKQLVYMLICKWNWTWLRWIICSICEMEMQLPLIFNSALRNYYNYCDITTKPNIQSSAQLLIPKNTCYCEKCPFQKQSKIAKFLLGEQCSGYCYYLAKGDFSFLRPTDLLWDGIKCCDVNYMEEE